MQPSRRLTRSVKVRTDGDMLVEGWEADGTYGWVSNMDAHANIDWGDWYAGGSPQWWLGEDTFDGRPIGPNGPGLTGGYGWDGRARLPHGGWWNRPSEGRGLLPAVTRCTQVIVSPIIRTPWVVETGSGSEPPPLWLADPMLIGGAPGTVFPTQPAGLRMSEHSFWSTMLTHALWWGRGAVIFAEAADLTPLPGTLRHLNPYMVGVDGRGRWVIDPHGDDPVETDFDGRFEVNGRVWRLLVLRGLPPNDDVTPEGVLTRHFDTLRLGAAVSKYVASTFASGVPSGYLKVSTPNATPDAIRKLKADWMDAHGRGRRSVAVLNATTDYTPISISPVDADANNLTRVARTDVAHAFGLSAAWLDTGDSSLTYSNMVDRRRDLLDHTLAGWGQQFTEILSSVLPYGNRVRIMWTAYTSPNIEQQMPALVAGVSAGILSPVEARALLGLTGDPPPQPAAPAPAGWASTDAVAKSYPRSSSQGATQ